MTFGQWPDGVHTHFSQLKRIMSAIKIKPDKIRIDTEKQTAFVDGSKTYAVSLDHCDCADFAMERLPCKHIYRLAIALHLFDPHIVATTTADFDRQCEIDRYATMHANGIISTAAFVKIASAIHSA